MKPTHKAKKIGVSALCRVSSKGGAGVYLYIPRNFAEVYGIVMADYAEIEFRKIFKKTWQEKKGPVDLTPRIPHKRQDKEF